MYLGGQGIPAAASQASWAAYGKVLKIFFGTSRNMKSWLVACWEKIRNRGIAAVTACLSGFRADVRLVIFIHARLLRKIGSRRDRIGL